MVNLISLFSGIGAFEKALSNAGIEYNLINYCEIDKHASQSYSAIHNVPENKNLWDITKVDINSLPAVDLITYGFPCQDISVCGKQKGFTNLDGTSTRSGLFFEALKIIEHCKPKIAIAENVKNLTSSKFSEQFKIVLESLEQAGYNNYWKVLNAKNYGIPQNRERVFIISIRKDIDNKNFSFPQAVSLDKKLQDLIISGNVDRDIALCLTARYPGIKGSQDYMRRRYFGKHINQVVFENTTAEEQKAFFEANAYGQFNCLGHIRALYPAEAFKLMGFSSQDCEKCEKAGISENELLKQAGNSIVVNVLEEIFKSLNNVLDNKITLQNQILEALNDFKSREYGLDPISCLPKDGIISLAYTTYDFGDEEERDIQVEFDLSNLKYLNYIDNDLVLEVPVLNLEEFLNDLKWWDFDDMIYFCVDKGYELYGEE